MGDSIRITWLSIIIFISNDYSYLSKVEPIDNNLTLEAQMMTVRRYNRLQMATRLLSATPFILPEFR